MCGTLKYANVKSKIGDKIRVVNPYTRRLGTAIWSGFATEEKEYWWKAQGHAITVCGLITGFIEKKYEFIIPDNSTLIMLGLRKDIIIKGKVIGPAKSVKLLTRPAISPLEKEIHDRWPIVNLVNGGNEPYIFNIRDCKL